LRREIKRLRIICNVRTSLCDFCASRIQFQVLRSPNLKGKISASNFYKRNPMTFKLADSHSPGNQKAMIETLARETGVPIAIVEELYLTQRTQMEETARVKTYLPVLISSRVKHILNLRKVSRQESPQVAPA
jgi:hypothetical protein